MRRIGALLVVAVFCCLALAGPAVADQTVHLKVGFTPNRPNASTTIHFGFVVGAPHGAMLSPVTAIALELPVGMGLGLTTLGEDICTPQTLETKGFRGCSQNALMGLGHAVIELPVGAEIIRSTADVKIFMGVPMHHHTVMMFDAVSVTPVSAEILFPGELVPDQGGLGASLDTLVPDIPTWPEGPDATVVKMQSTLGPEHLIYYHRVYGRRVGYHPIGMAVPAVCPRGGYRFVIHLGFQDGTRASAVSSVSCRG